jgi:Domain of unknown function (DUF1802)
MSQGITLTMALCLSKSDSTALSTGRSIAALSRIFVNSVQRFALCSVGESSVIEAWAELDSCRMYTDDPQIAESLSWQTIWPKQLLQTILEEKKRIFLNVLRVYHLDTPVEIPATKTLDKLGSFVKLPTGIEVGRSKSVLSDLTFKRRRTRLADLHSPEHPSLESLQGTISDYAKVYPDAKALDHDLRIFLGWADEQPKIDTNSKYDWIQTIASSGKSSDGDLFEKRVRQSFLYLGFTNTLNNIKASLNPNATGGAGGIDIYCEKPFPIVGECKASKHESVPNGVCAQLINLGTTHLGKDKFEAAIKVIFASGRLTLDHAEPAAIQNEMNVMRPETLQRLVELKAAHPGAINLLELKPRLETAPFGTDADQKVNEFIDQIWQRIKLRSHIVKLIKNYQENVNSESASVSDLRAIYMVSQPPHPLNLKEMYDILIELASPLTGYLGKAKGTTWESDRFYFLRDLTL